MEDFQENKLWFFESNLEKFHGNPKFFIQKEKEKLHESILKLCCEKLEKFPKNPRFIYEKEVVICIYEFVKFFVVSKFPGSNVMIY